MYKEGQNMDNINQDFSQLMSQKDFHKSDKYFDLLMTILHIYNLRFEEIKSELPKRKFLARKKSSDFEMIGKDISSLQTLINQLETARNNQLEEEEEANNESSGLFGNDENTVENILDENILQNNANISNSLVNNY